MLSLIADELQAADDPMADLLDELAGDTSGNSGSSSGGGSMMAAANEAYLTELSSYSVERLQSEPSRLQNEIHSIQTELEELCFRHSKAFVQTADSVKDIKSEVHTVKQRLLALNENLPVLEEHTAEFLNEADDIGRRRRTAKLTLQCHQQLMEILEIPLLMDAFVKNECYDDALELESFVARLQRVHHDLHIIQDIGQEVAKCTRQMELQLLSRLRSPKIQLSECVQIVTFLRRLDRYTEAQLKLTFIKHRDMALQSALDAIPMDDANLYLINLTSVYKKQLASIVRNYGAIFGQSSSSTGVNAMLLSPKASLLFSWINQRVTAYLYALDSLLRQLSDGAQIANQLESCMGFAASLARVGMDLRSLLIPYFERTIFHLFASNVTNATVRFVNGMDFASFTPLPKDLSSFEARGMQSDNAPPIALLQFTSLAHLTNDLVQVFNQIRLCAPISLRSTMASHLRDALTHTANALKMFAEDNRERMDERQRSNFELFCQLFVGHFLPHIDACFDLIFGTRRTLQVDSIARIVADETADDDTQLDDVDALLAEAGVLDTTAEDDSVTETAGDNDQELD